MNAHPKITVINSTETSWRGDHSRGRAREPLPPTPPTPPGLPRRSEPSQRSLQSSPSPPPPRGRTYVVEPKEAERARHTDIPKKRTVRFMSGIPLPFISRRRVISEVPKREFVLVRRRQTTHRSHSPEPSTVRQPVHQRPSARSPSHERPEVVSAPFQYAAGQTTHHMRDQSRQHGGGSSPQSPSYEHYPRPGFHSTGPAREEHKRLEREIRRRQDAEIIAQETAEALARAQRELAQRERERRQRTEEAARLREEAEDLVRTQEAQRETERHKNAERIALARAEDAARAQRERCQRSEQAVRATREDLAHIKREAEIIRRERDEAIRRNSELEQRANIEGERQQAMRRQHEEIESEASERVEKNLQRAREQAEKYAAESERLRRARATGIPRSPRHQVALHQLSSGRGSLEERDERFLSDSAHAGNRKMVDRTIPSSPRRDTRRDSGVSGGRGSFEERGDRFIDEAIQAENRRREERIRPRLRRIERTVYDDDSLRRGRRWA